MAPVDPPEVVAYKLGAIEGRLETHNEHLSRLGDGLRDQAESTRAIVTQLEQWKQDRGTEMERVKQTKANIAWLIGLITFGVNAAQTVLTHTVIPPGH